MSGEDQPDGPWPSPDEMAARAEVALAHTAEARALPTARAALARGDLAAAREVLAPAYANLVATYVADNDRILLAQVRNKGVHRRDAEDVLGDAVRNMLASIERFRRGVGVFGPTHTRRRATPFETTVEPYVGMSLQGAAHDHFRKKRRRPPVDDGKKAARGEEEVAEGPSVEEEAAGRSFAEALQYLLVAARPSLAAIGLESPDLEVSKPADRRRAWLDALAQRVLAWLGTVDRDGDAATRTAEVTTMHRSEVRAGTTLTAAKGGQAHDIERSRAEGLFVALVVVTWVRETGRSRRSPDDGGADAFLGAIETELRQALLPPVVDRLVGHVRNSAWISRTRYAANIAWSEGLMDHLQTGDDGARPAAAAREALGGDPPTFVLAHRRVAAGKLLAAQVDELRAVDARLADLAKGRS